MSNTKQYFDVKVDFLIPTTITYRVQVETEEEALMEINKPSARRISSTPRDSRKIKLKATVYQPNSNLIKLSKTYRHI